MVHGDDWKYGKDKNLRQKAINSLRKVGGKLIEIPFYKKYIKFSRFKKEFMSKAQPHLTGKLFYKDYLRLKIFVNS